jgi:hypothetical protein
MAVNPDPKPGRWILPLVVLGMVAFTYFFVRELPEASTETTLVSSPGTSTTVPDTEGPTTTDGGTGTTLDPETQGYLDEIDAINEELQVQRTDLVSVNDSFNEEPRGVEFGEAEDRFEAIQTTTQELVDRQEALTPPAVVATNHTSLLTELNLASDSITQALEGLRSTDTGQQRNSAVEAFTTAASNYDTEVTNTVNAAGG